jgi:hypothetical protein
LECLKETAGPLLARGLKVGLKVEAGPLVASLSGAVAAIHADLATVELQDHEDPYSAHPVSLSSASWGISPK